MSKPAIVVAPGYKGDPNSWCFWDEEFPGDRSYGPYSSKAKALAGVKRFVSWEEVTPPVKVLELSDIKHFDDDERRCYDYGCTEDCPVRRTQ